MPDPKDRKRNIAKQRLLEKYIRPPKENHPFNAFPPIKEHTEMLRKLMETKNYLNVITQIDMNQYFLNKYYMYCDYDIWACGEGIVFNSNPDKKIYCSVICTKLKKSCICYDEYQDTQFITICPNCGKVVTAIRNTDFKCKHCKFCLDYKHVNNMPYVKLNCEMCPVEIGWDKIQELSKPIRNRLVLTDAVKKAKTEKEIYKMMKDLEDG